MTKKVFYNLGLALIDFVVIFLICILAMFIITRDSEYLEGLNTFIPYFLNILWENPKIIAQILINSELLDIKNCLSSFFMNNFFENVLSEYYIEDNLIIVLTLMLKNEINNLKNTRDFDNFLNFNSASRFLLSELRKKK